MKINTAIVIAGGVGSRLKELNNSDKLNLPKPMIKVLGKPILEYILIWLRKQYIENVIIGVAYKKEKIIEYFGDGKIFGLNIFYSNHSIEDGTGDAFRKAIENTGLRDEFFYALNCDQFTDFRLSQLFDHHISSEQKPSPLATILLIQPVCPFGIVETGENGLITSFKEKPRLNLQTNGGIYLFHKNIKSYLADNIETVTFVNLSKAKRLQSVFYRGFWDTINTYKDLGRVEKVLKKNKKLRLLYEI
jgi:NDP-sugar pyrophosphorylase family protein